MEVGQLVTFSGYQDGGQGMVPKLNAGDRCRVAEVGADEGGRDFYRLVRVDASDEDWAYEDEFEVVDEDAPVEGDAPPNELPSEENPDAASANPGSRGEGTPVESSPRGVEEVDLAAVAVGERLRKLDADCVAQLAASIREVGLQTPISVIPEGDGYRLVAGLHRLEACRGLGWTTIPATVMGCGDDEAKMWELAENLQRKELAKKERDAHLKLYAKLLAKAGSSGGRGNKGTVAAVAEGTGTSPSTVRRVLDEARKEQLAALKAAWEAAGEDARADFQAWVALGD